MGHLVKQQKIIILREVAYALIETAFPLIARHTHSNSVSEVVSFVAIDAVGGKVRMHQNEIFYQTVRKVEAKAVAAARAGFPKLVVQPLGRDEVVGCLPVCFQVLRAVVLHLLV